MALFGIGVYCCFWNFTETNLTAFRSSCPEMFCKNGVPRNFGKFTGKQLCQSLFFNKVADLRASILLKRRLWHRCFPVNFSKFLRNTFSYRTPLMVVSQHFWQMFYSFEQNSKIKRHYSLLNSSRVNRFNKLGSE